MCSFSETDHTACLDDVGGGTFGSYHFTRLQLFVILDPDCWQRDRRRWETWLLSHQPPLTCIIGLLEISKSVACGKETVHWLAVNLTSGTWMKNQTGSKPSVTIEGHTKHSHGLHSPIDTKSAFAYKSQHSNQHFCYKDTLTTIRLLID